MNNRMPNTLGVQKRVFAETAVPIEAPTTRSVSFQTEPNDHPNARLFP